MKPVLCPSCFDESEEGKTEPGRLVRPGVCSSRIYQSKVVTPLARNRSRHLRGFSLVESLVAVSVAAIAGTALLTSIASAISSSTYTVQTSMAQGLAEQMLDEIAAVKFPDGTVPSTPSSYNRIKFDDIDDYDNWSSNWLRDKKGRIVGAEGFELNWFSRTYYIYRPPEMRPNLYYLKRFSRDVSVERIRPDAANGWTTTTDNTNHRRVTVAVSFTDGQDNTQTLAEMTRIFSYVPITP